MGHPARPSPIEITIQELDPIPALVRTVFRSAEEGRVATWALVDILPQLKPHHWAAYAREAGCHQPSPHQVAEVIRQVRLKIQFMG